MLVSFDYDDVARIIKYAKEYEVFTCQEIDRLEEFDANHPGTGNDVFAKSIERLRSERKDARDFLERAEKASAALAGKVA